MSRHYRVAATILHLDYANYQSVKNYFLRTDWTISVTTGEVLYAYINLSTPEGVVECRNEIATLINNLAALQDQCRLVVIIEAEMFDEMGKVLERECLLAKQANLKGERKWTHLVPSVVAP